MQELSALTSREQEIFNLLLNGVSPKEIAYKLNIHYKTVDTHRSSLYRKLGVQSIQELMAKYSPEQIKTGSASSGETGQKHKPSENRPAKGRRLGIFVPVGIAVCALSLLFAGYFLIKPPAKPVKFSGFQMGLYANADKQLGGNSTAKLYLTDEIIDGIAVNDVINIEITLAEGEYHTPNVLAATNYFDLVDQLKKAKGIRFKAIGDGKTWNVQFHTVESPATDWASYEYAFRTVPNKIVNVDIPYSSLRQPSWLSREYNPEKIFEFGRERIVTMVFSTSTRFQELGSSSIKIFDFEIY
ncbi:MAG: helix-turn-helix transcriptional regulator [Treponema sp.]|jgi:DNA-binding CsgD family transcriptional regulator|nr:helix-turn-helix transcriptional regulator [Treponema sp.]